MAETADIKRQIVYGDLPESELEEIIRLAIAQRNKKRGIVASAKKELPEEDAVSSTGFPENEMNDCC